MVKIKIRRNEFTALYNSRSDKLLALFNDAIGPFTVKYELVSHLPCIKCSLYNRLEETEIRSYYCRFLYSNKSRNSSSICLHEICDFIYSIDYGDKLVSITGIEEGVRNEFIPFLFISMYLRRFGRK